MRINHFCCSIDDDPYGGPTVRTIGLFDGCGSGATEYSLDREATLTTTMEAGGEAGLRSLCSMGSYNPSLGSTFPSLGSGFPSLANIRGDASIAAVKVAGHDGAQEW